MSDTIQAVTLSVTWHGCAHTEQIGTLMAALAEAQAEMRMASKDAANPHLKNKYADLASVWSAWQEAGPKHGLGVAQFVEAGTDSVTVHSILGHASGEWLRDTLRLPWEPQKGITSSQAIGSAMTYARRYALAALVGVCPEDDDANTAGPPRPQPEVIQLRAALLAEFTSEEKCRAWVRSKVNCDLEDLSAAGLREGIKRVKDAKAAHAAAQQPPAESPAVEPPKGTAAPLPTPPKADAKKAAPPPKTPAAQVDLNKLKAAVNLRFQELFGKDVRGKDGFYRWCDRYSLLAINHEEQRPSIALSNVDELRACLDALSGLTEEVVADFYAELEAERQHEEEAARIAFGDVTPAADLDPWDTEEATHGVG